MVASLSQPESRPPTESATTLRKDQITVLRIVTPPTVFAGLQGGSARSQILSLLQQLEFDASIFLTALVRRVVGDGLVHARASCLDAAGVDALGYEVFLHGRGARLRELEVLWGVADVVGVAADGDAQVRVGLEDLDGLIEQLV